MSQNGNHPGGVDDWLAKTVKSPPQLKILALCSEGPISTMEAASACGLSRSGVYKHLKELLEDERIERVKDPRGPGRPRVCYRATSKTASTGLSLAAAGVGAGTEGGKEQ